MEILRRVGKFCGALCGVILTFVITMGTLAVTNALSPTPIKEQMTSTANLLVETTSKQALSYGVPKNWVEMVQANLGVDQLIAVVFMTFISIALATLALMASLLWLKLFGKKKVNPAGLEELASVAT